MSSSNLIRLSGLAAVVAGVLLTIGDLLSFATEPENLSEWATMPSYFFVWFLYLLGGVLLLVALVGLYAYQSEAAGILGLVGFVGAFSGTALVLGAIWAQLFVAPFLAVQSPEPSIPSPRDRWPRGSRYRSHSWPLVGCCSG